MPAGASEAGVTADRRLETKPIKGTRPLGEGMADELDDPAPDEEDGEGAPDERRSLRGDPVRREQEQRREHQPAGQGEEHEPTENQGQQRRVRRAVALDLGVGGDGGIGFVNFVNKKGCLTFFGSLFLLNLFSRLKLGKTSR